MRTKRTVESTSYLEVERPNKSYNFPWVCYSAFGGIRKG